MNSPKVRRGNVYKIAFKAGRKNAKRHLLFSFQAESEEEAITIYKETIERLYKQPENKFKTFELLTGNWKPVETEEK